MKHPQPDIGDILRASFINNMGSSRKLKRLWGTTTVTRTTVTDQLGEVLDASNGPIDTTNFAPERLPLITTTESFEVLKDRQYYYPNSSRSENYEKLFKFLGAYNDIEKNPPQGVQSAWLYINKNKGSALPEPEETGELSQTYHDFIAHNLNQLWWDNDDGVIPEGLTLTTSIVIEGELNTTRDTSVITTNLLDPNATPGQTANAIINNYDDLWSSCLISQQGIGVINKGSIQDEVTKVVTQDEDDLSPDDPWLDVIARYALRSNGIPCTIKDVEKGYGKTEAGRIYYTYVVTLEIPYYEFSTTTPMVDDVVTDLNSTYTSLTRTKLSYPNGYYTQYGIKSMDSTDLEDDPTIVTRPYRLWEDEAVEIKSELSSIWVQADDGKWYLRADVFDSPRTYSLTYKKLYSYVVTLIDSGYKKKKVSWWKKALAVIVFVVAVVLALPTGGASLTWTAVATAILVGALVLNLLALAFAATGNHEWASAFAEASKMIEPLVIIATIITLTNTLQQWAQKAAQKAAETSIKEMVTEFVEEMIDDFINNLTTGYTELMSGQITELSLQFASKMVDLVSLPMKLKIESINDRNKDLKAEYEKLVEEASREYDVLQGFMYIYGKPATADWSMYAAEFDRPYERGGGPLALGNVQRTTKQALRRADYSDSAFDNILVV